MTCLIYLFIYFFVDSEPLSFDDAMKDKKWRKAMEEEIKSIEKNNTFELSTIPKMMKLLEEEGGKIQSRTCY